jgi:hypothetical protein
MNEVPAEKNGLLIFFALFISFCNLVQGVFEFQNFEKKSNKKHMIEIAEHKNSCRLAVMTLDG